MVHNDTAKAKDGQALQALEAPFIVNRRASSVEERRLYTVIDTTHDLIAASAALDAAIARPKRGHIGASLAPLEPKIRAALKAKMTPTAIAKLLKANGVNASLDGLRVHIKAVADGKKPVRKRVAKSNGTPAVS